MSEPWSDLALRLLDITTAVQPLLQTTPDATPAGLLQTIVAAGPQSSIAAQRISNLTLTCDAPDADRDGSSVPLIASKPLRGPVWDGLVAVLRGTLCLLHRPLLLPDAPICALGPVPLAGWAADEVAGVHALLHLVASCLEMALKILEATSAPGSAASGVAGGTLASIAVCCPGAILAAALLLPPAGGAGSAHAAATTALLLCLSTHSEPVAAFLGAQVCAPPLLQRACSVAAGALAGGTTPRPASSIGYFAKAYLLQSPEWRARRHLRELSQAAEGCRLATASPFFGRMLLAACEPGRLSSLPPQSCRRVVMAARIWVETHVPPPRLAGAAGAGDGYTPTAVGLTSHHVVGTLQAACKEQHLVEDACVLAAHLWSHLELAGQDRALHCGVQLLQAVMRRALKVAAMGLEGSGGDGAHGGGAGSEGEESEEEEEEEEEEEKPLWANVTAVLHLLVCALEEPADAGTGLDSLEGEHSLTERARWLLSSGALASLEATLRGLARMYVTPTDCQRIASGAVQVGVLVALRLLASCPDNAADAASAEAAAALRSLAATARKVNWEASGGTLEADDDGREIGGSVVSAGTEAAGAVSLALLWIRKAGPLLHGLAAGPAVTAETAMGLMRDCAMQLLPPIVAQAAGRVREQEFGWVEDCSTLACFVERLHDVGLADVTAAAGTPALLGELLAALPRGRCAAMPERGTVWMVSAALQSALDGSSGNCDNWRLGRAAPNAGWRHEVRRLGLDQVAVDRMAAATATPGTAHALADLRNTMTHARRQGIVEPPATWDIILLAAVAAAAQGPEGTASSPPSRGCWHRRCTNISGVSEAALRLRSCGGCHQARYCGAACQERAWHDGHKVACKAWQKQQQQAAQ